MRLRSLIFAVMLGLTWGCDCGPAEEDGNKDSGSADAGLLPDAWNPDTAQPDIAQPDSAQPDTAQPDTAQPDAAQPDAAQPDTAQPDAGLDADATPAEDAYTPPTDAGLPPLVSHARVVDLGASAVSSYTWGVPTHKGSAFGDVDFYRLEGNNLVAYATADLENDTATVSATASIQPSSEATEVTGLSVAVYSQTPERIWFTYAKADYTGGIGTATKNGSIENVETEVASLATSSNFPILIVGESLVAVDDMDGAIYVYDIHNYTAGSPLDTDTLRVTSCSGQPENFYIGKPFPLADSYVAISYTGAVASTDEGKGGYFVLDIADSSGSPCKQHIALEAGAETDSHVAVGGMVVDDDRLLLLWDHYGGGYPAPRYPSKIQSFGWDSSGGPSIGSTPLAEADLAAVWPTGVFALGNGEVVVMESPDSGYFQLEVFAQDLTQLGLVRGPQVDSFAGPFYGYLPQDQGDFWVGLPDALVRFARPPLVRQFEISELASSTISTNPWAAVAQYGAAFGQDHLYRVDGNTLRSYSAADLLTQNASQTSTASIQPSAEATDVSGLSIAVDSSVTPERIWVSYSTASYTGGLSTATNDSGTLGQAETGVAALSTMSDFPLVIVNLGSGTVDHRLLAVDDMAGVVRRFDISAYATGQVLGEEEMTLDTCGDVPENIYLGSPYALGKGYVAVSYTGSVGTADEAKGGFVVLDAAAPATSACQLHVALEAGPETDSHVAVSGIVPGENSLLVIWDHYGAGYPAPRYPSKLLSYTFATDPLSVSATPADSVELASDWPAGVYSVGDGQVIVLQSPEDGWFVVELFDDALELVYTYAGSSSDTYSSPFKGLFQQYSAQTFWLGLPTGLAMFERR